MRAQDPVARAYKIKIAYIYNFTRYVTWPDHAFDHAAAPFVIGVLGPDPFSGSLELLESKRGVDQRRIDVVRFEAPEDYTPCNILFVAGPQHSYLHDWAVKATAGTPVLLIGESPEFARKGATVAFYNDADGTIGFSINVDAAKRQQLTFQASVLKLANVVRDSQPSP